MNAVIIIIMFGLKHRSNDSIQKEKNVPPTNEKSLGLLLNAIPNLQSKSFRGQQRKQQYYGNVTWSQ